MSPPNKDVILGIETSCDETAAAVVRGGREVLSSVVSSQIEMHADYGGVVPEVASRAHLELLLPVVDKALQSNTLTNGTPDAIAVTNGPGLIGALLVGVSAAKALAIAWDIPLVAVNHLEAHLYATFLDEPEIQMPLVVLLVSGGHTMLIAMEDYGRYEILGQTRDDAVGEAFDKTARVLGLGYPGGPLIDKLSEAGDPTAIPFPRPMLHSGDLDFSFSGLKTAVVNHVRANYVGQPNTDSVADPTSNPTSDIAASFQASVVDVLTAKTITAVAQVGAKGISLAGGVAANSQLRQSLKTASQELGIPCYLASREMCTDNAAMVAAAGWHQLNQFGASSLDVSANPSAKLSRTN